jgi:hypothetical protein
VNSILSFLLVYMLPSLPACAMFSLPFATLLLQAVPGITHSQVGTPVHGVKFVCMHAEFSERSIEDAADAMCNTREAKRKSKEKEREEKSKETERKENKNYISTYTVAFRKCNHCPLWAMQFKGSGKVRPFGGWNTLVDVRKNFHARVREKEKDFLLRQKEVDGIQSFIGEPIDSTPPEEEGDFVSGEHYRGILNK